MPDTETIDPLVAELRGQAVLQNPDGPQPDPGVGGPDPLEVAPPAPAPAAPRTIAQADEKHSTRTGGKGFRVTVSGIFYAQSKDSDRKLKKSYRLDFNLPHLDGALSMIVGKLLVPALVKKFGDEYVGYQTHEIVEAVPLSPQTPETNNLQYMTRERLAAYVAEYKVPVVPSEYPDVVHLRAAVIDWTLNPLGFAEREAERQAGRKETAELAALNPDLAIAAP